MTDNPQGSYGSNPQGSYGSNPQGSNDPNQGAYSANPQGAYSANPQGGYGPGPYGSMPPGQPARPVVVSSGMATAALVLGILALLTSWTVIGGVLLGLLAVIFGFLALRKARRGLAAGRGRAIAGIILGLLSIAIAVALIALGVAFFNSDEAKDLRSCLDDAGSNQSQIQQCEDEFRDQITNNP